MSRSLHLTLAILLGMLAGSHGQNTTMEITFNATYQGETIALDSVFIQNLTQQSDTLLSDPDDPLVLDITSGMNGSPSMQNNMFELKPNIPNPFRDKTTFHVFIPEQEDVELIVRNIAGQKIAVRQMILEAGIHTFSFYPGNDRFYLLSASYRGETRSMKIISLGSNAGSHAALVYTGIEFSQPEHKVIPSSAGFLFSPGDSLRFTGYAETPAFTIGSDEIEDSPATSETYTFEIIGGIRCPGEPMVTDIEGNVYATVLIGDQCWMRENLKTATYKNGNPIPNVTNDSLWTDLTNGAFAWYENDLSWKNLYGALYNWFAVADVNGLCPEGWRVPYHGEWEFLKSYIGGSVWEMGNKLKTCRQENSPLGGECATTEHPRWDAHGSEYGTDEFGFSALPGGSRFWNGAFYESIGNIGGWWSATEFAAEDSYLQIMYNNVGSIHWSSDYKQIGYSVRCIRESGTPPPGIPCPEAPTVTDIDGNVYNTVLIGDQCWMKENLKTTTYRSGTPIPNVTGNAAWSNLTTGAYSWYDNNISWKEIYGAIYNWYAVDDTNGLCPDGWHVPGNEEWYALTGFIGGSDPPNGNKLKSCRQINSPLGGDCSTGEHPRWTDHSIEYGTDDYGFSGLPGSVRGYTGEFSTLGNTGAWWTSTQFSTSTLYAWNRILNYDNGAVNEGYNFSHYGRSVRCVRN